MARTIERKRAAKIGPIIKSDQIIGLTMSEFSLIEIILHCLEYTGPAEVLVCTWVAAIADIKELAFNPKVTNAKWIFNSGFYSIDKKAFYKIGKLFPEANAMATASHAKFVTIRNESWDLVIRSSMNLNKNPRIEMFEISNSSNLAKYLGSIFDALAEEGMTLKQSSESWTTSTESLETLLGKVNRTPLEVNFFKNQKGVSYGEA